LSDFAVVFMRQRADKRSTRPATSVISGWQVPAPLPSAGIAQNGLQNLLVRKCVTISWAFCFRGAQMDNRSGCGDAVIVVNWTFGARPF
jgi:hypothetical protein